MYYENEKMIVDRNTAGNSYIIDVESGFKAEFNIIRGIAYCWPDGITEKDIERAKADNLDVSRIEYPFVGHECKEVKDICKRIEDFLKSSKHFARKVEKVRFNFI